jgi:transcriptional regulator with XRE-family HTH domain
MHNKLRVRRAELELSQHAVAQKIEGLSRDRLHRIERGYADPTADEIAALAKALDATAAELFPTLAAEQAEAR